MPSLFATLAAISSHTVDAVMSEALRMVPMKAGRNKAGGPDTDRAARDVVGVYREIVRRTKVDSATVGKAFDHSFLTPEKTISIDVGAVQPGDFVKGDQIVRLDEPGAPSFEITAAEPDGRTRILFSVVAVST